ncbi:hypothetical protein NG99_07360 [Erwinia typographi]|uniref:Uncharacterized protein n=1 Tax=Erwinia typographi TaxID=371042 RepID=A0A0A3Z9I1_9GAMM|nr:hypothetical protein [Erwinia typographi]KGT94439.1 hypothetical protein NG99_07360 [Erwinia typographi]
MLSGKSFRLSFFVVVFQLINESRLKYKLIFFFFYGLSDRIKDTAYPDLRDMRRMKFLKPDDPTFQAAERLAYDYAAVNGLHRPVIFADPGRWQHDVSKA